MGGKATQSFFVSRRSRTRFIAVGGILLVGVAIAAWSRVGLLDLPSVSSSITVAQTGLADLAAMGVLDGYLRGGSEIGFVVPASWIKPPEFASEPVAAVRQGILRIRQGDVPAGLVSMREGIRLAPDNLALGNAYRMEVFRLRREHLRQNRSLGALVPEFPPHLDGEPIAFFRQLTDEHPCREAKLQLALAWVDEMLLFPPLEIKAPASVQAVDILSAVLEGADESYVPALFARGLNHLHRPARLVWPETTKTPKDVAVRDIARCVAIGRKLNVGSKRLHATLAMTLGDAYVKAGKYELARSWWQIAQNLSHDPDTHAAVRRRYAWQDEEMIDRLEEELDRARAELEHPMTDLALMWTD